MGLFGKDKNKAPEAVQPDPTVAEQNAGPLFKSSYFEKLRTDAFTNQNAVQNFVEFWVALKVDPAADKWRIMHYSLYDLDKADGRFDSEVASKKDVDFLEAIRQLSMFQVVGESMLSHTGVDMVQKFPPEQFPALKVHFYDIDQFRRGANIEGLAFDSSGNPYQRVQGMITVGAAFKRSEVEKSILAVEQARDIPSVEAKIEGGILSDIFATASSRAATLDNILKIGQVLSTMDDFALQVGAFYLSIQRAVGRDDKFDRIEGLQPEEKKEVLAHAGALTNVQAGDSKPFPKILGDLIPSMNASLETVKNLGVHVEPFQKFAAECELYANLLYASQNIAKLEKGFVSVNNSDTSLITEIRQSVDRAQKKYTELGGTQEDMDKLKAWVVNPKKEQIPGWLPGFLTRYYETRGKVMQKVQDRAAGLTDVKTMSVDVKPPVTDQYNGASGKAANQNTAAEPASKPSSRPAAPGGNQP